MLVKRGANLLDPEDVKSVIARQPWKNGVKRLSVYAYDALTKLLKIEWTPPKYKQGETLPFIPEEKELDALISACRSRRMAAARMQNELRDILKKGGEKELPKETDEAVRKRVERHLKVLEKWGLVKREKEGRRYFWYTQYRIYEGVGSWEKHQRDLDHSKRLLEAFKVVIDHQIPIHLLPGHTLPDSKYDFSILLASLNREKEGNIIQNVRGVLEHLRVYPDIEKVLEEYDEIHRKTLEQQEAIKRSIENEIEVSLPHAGLGSRPPFVYPSKLAVVLIEELESGWPYHHNIQERIKATHHIPLSTYFFRWDGKENKTIAYGDKTFKPQVAAFIENELKLPANQESIQALKGLEQKRDELNFNFWYNVGLLQLRVNHGEPLQGECFLCPRIDFT